MQQQNATAVLKVRPKKPDLFRWPHEAEAWYTTSLASALATIKLQKRFRF